MASEDSQNKSNEKNLEEFLHSLYPDINADKTQAYSFPFQFFQDILSMSTLSSGWDFFLCAIFYISFDFLIIFSSATLPWFNNFFPKPNLLSFSYISSKIAIQVVSSVTLIIVLNIIIAQWICLAIYDPIKHLSSTTATFLHVTFYHLPPILSLYVGFLFGCIVVGNTDDLLSTGFSTILSMLLSVVFILLNVGHFVFTIFTRSSMLIRKGYFSSWESPYGMLSLVVFFCVAGFFPFMESKYRHYCTVQSVILLFWSGYMIFSRQKPTYITSIANVIESKVLVDGIFFSILAICNIWLEIRFDHAIIVVQILYCLSCLISGALVSRTYYFIRSSVTESGSFNQAKFPNPSSCVTALRTGVNYSLSAFVQSEFVGWALLWRFSPSILPDIVRLYFVLKKNLKDLKVPVTTLSPLELISLKFLAFQVRQYEKFVLDESDGPIAAAREEAERLLQNAENVSNDFWTNRDYEQLSIAEYGKKMFRIFRFIQNSAMSYPHSAEIQELWAKFSKTVIHTPSQTVITHIPAFSYIECPGDTIYFFLNPHLPENSESRRQKRIESTTEHFISTFVNAAIKPIKYFYRFMIILTFLVGTVLAILFAVRSQKTFKMFSKSVQILTLSLSICCDAINGADKLLKLPSINFISKALKISLDEASLFRNSMQIINPAYNSAPNYLPLFEHTEVDLNLSICPKFTLGLLTHITFGDDTSIVMHACHLFWVMLYSNRTMDAVNEIISDQKVPDTVSSTIYGSVVTTCCVVIITGFVIICLYQRKRIEKLRESIENIVAMKSEICERGEPYSAFSETVYFILIFFISFCLFMYYIAFFFTIRTKEMSMKELTKQIVAVSNICRYSTLLIASSSIEITMEQEQSNDVNIFTPYLAETRKVLSMGLINSAYDMTLIGLDSTLESMINWTSANSDDSLSTIVVDYAQLISEVVITAENFNFLMSRLIFKENISYLLDRVFPEIAKRNIISAKYVNEPFWIYFVVISILLLITWHFVELQLVCQENWFFGISVLIRRAMAMYPERLLYIIGEILEDKPNYLDGLPMPIVVRNQKGIILYANQIVTQYTKHTIDQTIGQPYDEFFTENNAKHSDLTFSVEIRPFGSNNEFIILRDTSQFLELQKTYSALKERVTPKIGRTPNRYRMLFIECRFQTEKVRPELVFQKIENVNQQFINVNIIACGASYVNAISDIGNEEEAIKFVLTLGHDIFLNFRAAITDGIGALISLLGEGALVVVAGNVSKRATEANLFGLWGRIYLDYKVVERSGMEELEKYDTGSGGSIIEISPLSEQI